MLSWLFIYLQNIIISLQGRSQELEMGGAKLLGEGSEAA